MNDRPDPAQSLQRITVGLIGLAAVVLLIALASVVLRTATRDAPPARSAQANLVAEIAQANVAAPDSEPLADLGVAPPPGNSVDVPAGR